MKRLNLRDFFEVLKDFSCTQRKLVDAFLKLAGENEDWPKHGEITINGEKWKFRKHGAGACFINENTQEEIDIPTGLGPNPNKIDDWQLEIYFTSIPKIIVSFNNKEYNLHSVKCLKKLLANLACSNISIPISYEPAMKNKKPGQ